MNDLNYPAMKNKILIVMLCVGPVLFSCKNAEETRIETSGPEVVDFRLLPFELKDVTLLEGRFKKGVELNEKILLNYEPDRLLAGFRREAGLPQKAEIYGGWESATLAGHSLGHYLSACSMMYQTTGNEEFLKRARYIVDELEIVQNAHGDGYIGAMEGGKKVFEEEVAQGIIRSAGFDLNGIWAPFYTHHKVLAGLRDAYQLLGIEKALDIAVKFSDWIYEIIDDLDYDTRQDMLRCEYGGMNEVMADIYGLTGNEKYLEMSRLFHDNFVIDSLAAGIDVLPGKHGNTNIPKAIGLARRYELTGDQTDRKTAEFFWDRVVHYHSYVTGGNGFREYFGPAGKLRDRLGPNTTESCNVYNMLKLTDHLFTWEGEAEKADFYERALFNHIMAHQHPETGEVVYNLSLDMGGRKAYQNPFHFTCCIGTGMESHAKYNGHIFYHNNEELFVSQFIAAELNWEEKGLILRQETAYPEDQGTSLEFKLEQPLKLTLQIRYPSWAEKGMEVRVNGRRIRVKEKPGSFVAVSRTWKDGDRVEVKIPFTLRLETMPDDENRIAVFYGPVVLAGDLGPANDPKVHEPLYVPVFVSDHRNPAEWMEPVKGEVNTFITRDLGYPRDVKMKPFYQTHDRRYSIYWDLYTTEAWEKEKEAYEAELERIKQLEESTIDYFQPGEMQPERDHQFDGEHTRPERFRDRPARTATGGWFAFDLEVDPEVPNALVVEYWGGGYRRNRIFDILVNDVKLAKEDITSPVGNIYIHKQYDIPEELTAGKTKIRVKFEAEDNNIVGPVFGVRSIKK